MKKDLMFAPAMLLIGGALFFLRTTGMNAHIAISLFGVLVLAAYTALAKKDWKIPALEIAMRACYGIALISGIVIKIFHGIAALSVVHKASAALFMVLMIVLLANKIAVSKKA